MSEVVDWFDCSSRVQYRMPDAYDQEGGVNQEKRFSVAVERYRSARLVCSGQAIMIIICIYCHNACMELNFCLI